MELFNLLAECLCRLQNTLRKGGDANAFEGKECFSVREGIDRLQGVLCRLDVLIQPGCRLCFRDAAFCHVLGKHIQILSLGCDGFENRDAEDSGKLLCINILSCLFGIINHVEDCKHRLAEVCGLQKQEEVSLQRCGVKDDDKEVRVFLREVFPDHLLFHRVAGKGVDSRKVGDHELLSAVFDNTGLNGDGRSRIVADFHAQSG